MALPTPGVVRGSQSLLHRFGPREHKLLREFGGFVGGTAICQSMAQAVANPQLSATARRTLSLGVLIDPQTTTNLVPVRARVPSFNEAGYSFPRRWDPETEELPAAALDWYARAVIDAQRLRHATVILSPYHACQGESSRALETDLKLAIAGSKYVYDHGLAAPPADEPHPVTREYWVVIRLTRKLAVDDIPRIVALYAPLACTGYWIKIEMPLPLSPKNAEAIAMLAHSLKARTSRAVGLAGVGPLAITFAASGLDCVLPGHIRAAEQTAARPVWGSVFHPAYLRNFSVASEYGLAAFEAHPCECGYHVGATPPRGNARTRHSLWSEISEYGRLRGAVLPQFMTSIRGRVVAANEAADEIDAPLLDQRAWTAPLEMAMRLNEAAVGQETQ